LEERLNVPNCEVAVSNSAGEHECLKCTKGYVLLAEEAAGPNVSARRVCVTFEGANCLIIDATEKGRCKQCDFLFTLTSEGTCVERPAGGKTEEKTAPKKSSANKEIGAGAVESERVQIKAPQNDDTARTSFEEEVVTGLPDSRKPRSELNQLLKEETQIKRYGSQQSIEDPRSPTTGDKAKLIGLTVDPNLLQNPPRGNHFGFENESSESDYQDESENEDQRAMEDQQKTQEGKDIKRRWRLGLCITFVVLALFGAWLLLRKDPHLVMANQNDVAVNLA
jgi:hypothetical protein